MSKPTEQELDALLSQAAQKKPVSGQPTEAELDALLSGAPQSELGMSNGEMLAREATKMLPIAGSIVGGLAAGAPTLGMATLGGSALGAAGGKALQNVIEQNVFDQPKEVSDYTTDLAKEAAYDVAGNITGAKVVAPIVKGGLKMLGKGYTKVASSLSGIPEQSIETLYSKYDDVTKIDDIAIEADRIREVAQKDINQFKNIQNARISEGIAAKEKAPVDVTKVRQSLVSAIGKMDPSVDESKIKEIHKQIMLIDSIAKPKYDADYEKYLTDKLNYETNLQKYQQELGPSFNEKNPSLIFDDLQRTSNRPITVESIGQDPSKMYSEPYEVYTQQELFSLPQKQNVFNTPRGDDLLPVSQQFTLDKKFKSRMDEGYQAEILGARNTPKSYLSTEIPSVNAQQGQISFPIAPIPPKKPNFVKLEIPADQAYALQKNFQELAEYLPAGQVFKKKNFVDLSFQKAAAETRGALNKVIPEISQANAELAKLRRLDKNINKNLITPEKSMNALVSVGSGKNPMMQKQVEKLSAITGQDYLSPMQTLASAEKFANPDLISSLTTGRANIPIMLAGGAGAGAGGGMAGVAAAGATGLMSTPFGIKTAVGGLKAVESLGKIGINPKNISSEYLQYQASQADPIQQALDVLNVMQNYSPYEREQYIRKDPNLKPSERAKLLKENSRR